MGACSGGLELFGLKDLRGGKLPRPARRPLCVRRLLPCSQRRTRQYSFRTSLILKVTGRMNSVHDHHHKRTSITELLNPSPVPSTPSGQLDPSFAAGNLGDLATPSYSSPSHHARSGPSESSHPGLQIGGAGSSFSLRAANWEQGDDQASTPRRPDNDTAAATCRYGQDNAAHVQQQRHHGPVYPEQYHQRPRSVDAPANYGIDIQNWQHYSHDHTPTTQLVSPVYAEERTGAASPARSLSLSLILPSFSCFRRTCSQEYAPRLSPSARNQRSRLFHTRLSSCPIRATSTA
jgi:hypothetical protein